MTLPLPQMLLADVLAAGLGRRGSAYSVHLPEAADKSWEQLLAVASEQYVLPALAAALAALDLMPYGPGQIGEFLAASRAANTERNNELRGQLLEASRLLNRVGVRPVLLKGAIRLVDDLYPDLSWRTLRDLDLLVPASALLNSVAALEAAGYSSAEDKGGQESADFSHHHYPRMTHPCHLAPIELHTELFAYARGRPLLSGTAIVNVAASLAMEEAKVKIPILEHQLIHLIGHCQISDRGYACGRIALRDLVEAMLLLARPEGALAIAAAQSRFVATRAHRTLATFLAFLAQLGLLPTDCPTVPLDTIAWLQWHRLSVQASYPIADAIGGWLGWNSVLARKLALEVARVCWPWKAASRFGPADSGRGRTATSWL